jgi:hypothetical protein
MIDFNILKQKEEKGLVDYDVVDNMLVIKEKKYDEETGEEKNPETEFIDLKELLIKRKLYQDEIDKIDEILNKVKAKNKTIINLLTKQIYG